MTTELCVEPVPGPRGLPLLNNLLSFGSDPLNFMVRLREDHGDFVTWALGPRRCVSLSHPQLIAEVLGAVGRRFDIADIGWAHKQVVGNSVAFAHGDDWRRQRAVVQPLLRPSRVRNFAAIVSECAASLVDRWHEGDRIDVRAEMAALSQQVISRSLFSCDDTHSRVVGEAMAVVQREIAAELHSRIGLFLPAWVRTASRRRLLAARDTIDEALRTVIRERRAKPNESRDDILNGLLAHRDANGQALSDIQVREEAVALWGAGHETSVAALTWTWSLLAGAPDVRSRLSGELDRVLCGRTPTYEDYEQLPYTQQVLRESLRLYPPFWTLCMNTLHDTTLGGIPVPARTLIWCTQWSVHRDPRWFPDPNAFRPERFAPGTATAADGHAWFPFGSGPRACLGARFAQVAAVITLATVAQRFHLHIDSRPPAPSPGLTVQPAAPLIVTLHRATA
ncbi:cytochrome P450 [Streptomyces noursei]|uniref:cytochrome P450 n=1 Tax=Streptomyces noursei TaxID=1971 RepID=UPI0038122F01